VTHHGHQSRSHVGIIPQTSLDSSRRTVQNLSQRHLISPAFAWIGDLEHVSHELRDTIGPISLTHDPVDLNVLPNRESHKHHEQE
jgi:hypothetical protein